MYKLVLIFFLLSACEKKTDQYQENNHLSCRDHKIENEYIIHWTDSEPTKSKIINLKDFLDTRPDNLDFIEPNYKIQHNQLQSSSDSPLSSLFEDIGVIQAWSLGYFGQNIIIAVIDSGVDLTLPNLKFNLLINGNDNSLDGIDNDQNGYVDDRNGWNFSNNSRLIIDEVGHGTTMASLITGTSGIARSSRFLPVDIMSDDTGSEFDAKKAVDYAIQMKAQIINNSWSISCSRYLATSFLDYGSSNVIFINAAGNSFVDVYKNQVMLSSLNLPNFINVGSLSIDSTPSYFSGFGSTINMWTLGENISVIHNSEVMASSGTSLSAAIVSGAVAVLWSAYPKDTAVQIINRLKASSDNIGGINQLSIKKAF